MRLIAIEEHYATGALTEANAAEPYMRALAAMRNALENDDGTSVPGGKYDMQARFPALFDLSAGRLAEMDAAGIDLQVLSHTTPATETLEARTAIRLARETNDLLARAIALHPDRFAAFATLPTPDPDAAADELDRAVTKLGFRGAMINGHTHGRFMDNEAFWPIFECAERLRVPIYLHPTYPPAAVVDAYYGGLNPPVGALLATGAWGWHIETGLHALRLILGGVLDRYPELQLIIGHMGEAIPFMLERTDRMLPKSVTRLDRPLRDYFLENFYLTTSGFFTTPPFLCTLLEMGADRIIFSVDYPYSSNLAGRAFIDALPVNVVEKAKIAHLNVERVLQL